MRDVAVLLDIRHSQIAVFLFKIVLQIEIGVVLALHDRVVDACSVNGNPTDHILILQIQLFVFRQYILALADGRILIFWRFFLWLGVLHNLGNLRKGFRLLVYLLVMAVNLKAAKTAAPKKGDSGGGTENGFIVLKFIGISFLLLSGHKIFLTFIFSYRVCSVCFLGVGKSLQYSGYRALMPSMKYGANSQQNSSSGVKVSHALLGVTVPEVKGKVADP